MTGITSIICLLVGVAFPIGILFLILRRGSGQLSSADAYKEVARELNLKLDTRGIGLQGFHKKRHLWVGQVLLGAGRRTEVQGVLGLGKPLGYGLTLDSKRRKRIGGGITTGDEEFDKLFMSNAVQVEATQALLCEPVRTAAIHLHSLCSDVNVSDDLIRIKLPAPERNAAKLSKIVQSMEQLAEQLETQRAKVGAPEELEEIALQWHAFTDVSELSYERSFPSLTLEARWGHLMVVPRWMNSEFVSEIRIHFLNAQDTGFRLTPQRGPSVPWLTGQDIQVRDPSFDKAFVVKGYHPENIRKRLHAEARTLCLDLLKAGPFEITDDWMRVPNAPIEMHHLKRVIQQAIKVAEVLNPT